MSRSKGKKNLSKGQITAASTMATITVGKDAMSAGKRYIGEGDEE